MRPARISRRLGSFLIMLAVLAAAPAMARPLIRVAPGKSSRLDPLARGQLRMRLEQVLESCLDLGDSEGGELAVKLALDAQRKPSVGVVAAGAPAAMARCLEDALAHATWDAFPASLRWDGTLRYGDGDGIDVAVRSADGALDPDLVRNIVAAALEQRTGGTRAGSCMERFFTRKPPVSVSLVVTIDGARATAKASTMDAGGALACVRSQLASVKVPRGERARLVVVLARRIPAEDADSTVRVLTSGE